MRPDRRALATYVAAFEELAARIAAVLPAGGSRTQPVRMYVAGGAALHLLTGERVSVDVDAVFSHRIALPADLEVSYRDADGRARLLYFDRQYNDSFALMHEQAQPESLPLTLRGIDRGVLDIRLLQPVDLAVSTLARYSSQDSDDIVSLARLRNLRAGTLEKRATEAMAGYVGDLTRLRGNLLDSLGRVRAATRR